jgi:hypothetical protein
MSTGECITGGDGPENEGDTLETVQRKLESSNWQMVKLSGIKVKREEVRA